MRGSPAAPRRSCAFTGAVGTSSTIGMVWTLRKTPGADHHCLSGKRGGKPCIGGMRITVYDVLEYLASGMSEQEILDDFPDLTRDDIRACLSFAADRERKLVSLGES